MYLDARLVSVHHVLIRCLGCVVCHSSDRFYVLRHAQHACLETRHAFYEFHMVSSGLPYPQHANQLAAMPFKYQVKMSFTADDTKAEL